MNDNHVVMYNCQGFTDRGISSSVVTNIEYYILSIWHKHTFSVRSKTHGIKGIALSTSVDHVVTELLNHVKRDNDMVIMLITWYAILSHNMIYVIQVYMVV